MLTTDLEGEDEKDKGSLDNLLSQLIAELGMDKKVTFESLCEKQALRSVFFPPSCRETSPSCRGLLSPEAPSSADPLEMFSMCALAQACLCGSGCK